MKTTGASLSHRLLHLVYLDISPLRGLSNQDPTQGLSDWVRQLPQQVRHRLSDGAIHHQNNGILVLPRFLERLKLTAQQRGRHIGVLPPDDPRVAEGEECIVHPLFRESWERGGQG